MMFFFQLSEGGKSSQIKHFQDKTNKTALPIIDLIDAIDNSEEKVKLQAEQRKPRLKIFWLS